MEVFALQGHLLQEARGGTERMWGLTSPDENFFLPLKYQIRSVEEKKKKKTDVINYWDCTQPDNDWFGEMFVYVNIINVG